MQLILRWSQRQWWDWSEWTPHTSNSTLIRWATVGLAIAWISRSNLSSRSSRFLSSWSCLSVRTCCAALLRRALGNKTGAVLVYMKPFSRPTSERSMSGFSKFFANPLPVPTIFAPYWTRLALTWLLGWTSGSQSDAKYRPDTVWQKRGVEINLGQIPKYHPRWSCLSSGREIVGRQDVWLETLAPDGEIQALLYVKNGNLTTEHGAQFDQFMN